MSEGSFGAKQALSRKRTRYAIIRYTLDLEKRLVRTKFGKTLSAAALCDHAKALRADPNFCTTFAEIVDFTQVETSELNGDQLITLADTVDPFSPESKRAFVVRNPVQSHEVRMYGILRMSRNRVRTFDSFEEAEQWISSAREE